MRVRRYQYGGYVIMENDYIIGDTDIRRLIVKALEARERAYARYSQFKVGAALLAGRRENYSDEAECVGGESDNNDKNANGYRVFTGCNIENSSFGATNCAERTAFFKAVSEGVKEFDVICIVGGKDGILTEYAPPCGVCRQVMMEFCDPEEFEIILATDVEHYDIYTLKELLPLGFGPGNLKEK